MNTYRISVCRYRHGVKIGIFEEFDCIRDFIEYTDESTGVREAKDWLVEKRGIKDPEIVHPTINRMKLTYK